MAAVETAGMVASMASGLGAGIGTRKEQKRQAKYNKQLMNYSDQLYRQQADDFWKTYNSPTAQRAAMRAAGVNPFVEGSSGLSAEGVSPSATPPLGVDIAKDDFSAISGALQEGSASLFNMQETARNNEAMRDKTRAEAEFIRSQKVGQDNENSVFDLERERRQLELTSKRFQLEFEKYRSMNAKDLAQAELDKAMAELQGMLKRNDLTAVERDLAQKRLDWFDKEAQSRIDSSDAAGRASDAAARASDAAADESRARTDTENKLRDGRIRLTDAQSREVIKRSFGQHIRNVSDLDELSRVLTGQRTVSSLWGLVDKMMTFSDHATGTPNEVERRKVFADFLDNLAEYEESYNN